MNQVFFGQSKIKSGNNCFMKREIKGNVVILSLKAVIVYGYDVNEIIERRVELGWTESQKFEEHDRNQSRR